MSSIKKKLLGPKYLMIGSDDILDGYLIDYPHNMPSMESFGDSMEEWNDDFNKLMLLLINQDETNRLQQMYRYIKCLHMKNASYTTPLMLAAKMARGIESLQILEYILTNTSSEDIDAHDQESKTALMYACSNVDTTSSQEACKMLLMRRANVNLMDDKGCDALMLYCLNYKSSDSINLAKQLINHKIDLRRASFNNKLTSLMIACKRYEFIRNDELVVLLLKSGSDVDKVNRFGDTVLMQLCQGNLTKNLPIIKLLIRYSADAQVENRDGRNIFDVLFENKDGKKTDIVDMLVKD